MKRRGVIAMLLGLVGLGAVATAQEGSCTLPDGSTVTVRKPISAAETRRRRRCAREFLRQLQEVR